MPTKIRFSTSNIGRVRAYQWNATLLCWIPLTMKEAEFLLKIGRAVKEENN